MGIAWQALQLSLKVALWATAINAVFGIALAYLAAKKTFWGKEILDIFCTLPMVMPPTVLGYYLLVLIGKQGFLGKWLADYFGIHLIFTWQAAVIAACVSSFPLVYKPARAAFETLGTQLEQAAVILGLPERAVFFRVTLPLAQHGILAGLLLAFARCLGEFGATIMVAGSIPGKTQTLSIAVYEAVQAGQDDVANSLVLIISAVCAVLLLAVNTLSRRRNRKFTSQ
ncbi:molybdate ABC transporter permease subunit [Stenoxybacter acetivorans]|uniref:molybdate ABC transporter permease subunit n=1 Tax=Stenoxybacter acetivorans TaxID=422441 RepID=UPI0005655385|nr:molybdate ABC transporter permease subunit [Stenoxybacter acetivorans]